MKTVLTSGIKDEDQKKAIAAQFNASALLRGQVSKILNAKIESSWKGSMKESSYENPNWALKQADARGYERAMQEILNILN